MNEDSQPDSRHYKATDLTMSGNRITITCSDPEEASRAAKEALSIGLDASTEENQLILQYEGRSNNDSSVTASLDMDETLRSVQIANNVPDFGDARIRYGWIGNDQLMYVDDLPVYALARGQDEPLSDKALYQAYLQSLVDITEQAKRMSQELQPMNNAPHSGKPMKRPDHITDEYVLEQAQDDIESANGHQGNPIEGDAKVTADFDNFDLSVEAYEEAGTTVFYVSGSVDVHYEFSEYVQKGRSDEYEHKQWEKEVHEDYEMWYHIESGKLVEGEP